MPLSLVTGPANAGKARAVLAELRAHAGRGRTPLLVVPTEADQARYRRELAEGGIVLGPRVERFQGLLREVLRRSRLQQPTLGPIAREQLLASVASVLATKRGAASGEAAPTESARAEVAREGAAPAGLVRALGGLVAELQAARVTPRRLRAALEASELQSLGWACDVFERYVEELERMGRFDPELCAVRALDELRRKPSLWGPTPVLLYGFDSFTPLQLDAIETLAGPVEAPVTVSLSYEPGRRAFAARAGSFQRLLPLASSHVELSARPEYYAPRARPALHHLERSLLEERPPLEEGSERTQTVAPGPAVGLLEGSTPRAELELVAGEVSKLLRSGVPPDQIAIVHRSPQLIAELLVEVLQAHGVPCSVHRSVRFCDTAIGRGLLGLARCALPEGRTDHLLAWLRTPGVLSRPELADRLEAAARRCGASSAAQARAMWESERWPLDRLHRMEQAAERGGAVLIDALSAELRRLFIAPRRASGRLLDAQESSESHALTHGLRALDELRELALLAATPSPSPTQPIEALERMEFPQRSSPTPQSVALLDPLSLRARRVRALFLCGMQEGVFPAPAHPHPLLAREQRRALALGSNLLLPDESSETLEQERYLLYALCSRPEERLTLSWHATEEDGSPSARSLFVDDVCDLFSQQLTVERGLAPPLGEPALASPAFDPGPAPPEEKHCEEIVVRRISSADSPHEPSHDAPIAPLGDERVLNELRERTLWSASALECFNACPVRWFVERLLRPQTLDPDSEPLARGGLAHAALAQTLERLRERTGSARLTPSSLGDAKRLLREALCEQCAERPLSVAPERVPGAQRRLQSELERYLEWAAEHESPMEPTHLELEFGMGEEGTGLPALALEDGLEVRGRIDRIDISPGGEAVVYDYKARTAPPAARWGSDGALQVALYMRAGERLLGLPVAGGLYQPLSGCDLRPRGALDGDAGVELQCVRTDLRDPDELEELLEQCERVASRAVARVREGAIEPRPATCTPRGGCAYPTICRCQP